MSDRQTALRNIAYELGMDFLDKEDQSPVTYLRDFRLFRTGMRKKISNLMIKKDALFESELRLFDYQYTISTGKSTHTFKQTVFFIESKKLGLPEFFMQPEHLLHRFAEFLGFKRDINFEQYPQFSRQYYLQSRDEDYLRASFRKPVLDLFTDEPNWHMEGVNYYLILYRNKMILPVRSIKPMYDMGVKLAGFMEAESPFLDL